MDMTNVNYNVALGSEMMDAPQDPMEQEVKPKTSPEMVDDEIRSMILRRKEASRTHRQAKKDKWDQCWNHYKQVYNKTGKESWQSTTFIPASPKVAEVIASNMHSALLSPDRPVEYQARQPAFEQDVNDANDLIAVDMEKSEFKIHATDILRTLTIMGTGIGKVEYKKEYATVTIKERVRQIPGMNMMRQVLGLPPAPEETTSQQRVLVKDFASLRNVDPYNIFPEPGSEEISKDNWIIEEGKICNYKLLELQSDPESGVRNVTQELLQNNAKNIGNTQDTQEKDTANDEPIKVSAYLDPDQEHVLDEYWGPAPIWMVQPELYGDESRKYEMVNAWFWLIDGMYVVRAQITPFRDAEPPYVKGVYIRVPGQFWGIGPLELMLGLQVELNELRNTRMDNVNIMLNKVMAVIKSAIASGEYGRLVSGPGAIWLFDNIEDIRKALLPIDFPDVTSDSWRSSQEVYNEIQEVTAAVKATVGTGGGADQAGGDTFRGQLLNKQVASERFIMYARILEVTGFGKAVRKYYQRIYQYKEWKAAEEVLGQKRASTFKFVSPEELDTIAKLVPLGVTTMENKGVKLAQMAEQYKMFMGQPWFKAVDFARRMVVTGGDSDPDQYIMSDEEIKILNQMKRQLIGQTGMGPDLPGNDMGGGMSPQSPIAGNVPGPTQGQPMPAMPPRGPGASPIDAQGMPLS